MHHQGISKWHRRGWRAVRYCLALYLLACAGCAALQRRMIYFPPVFDSATVERAAAVEHLERWTNFVGQPIGWKRPSSVQPSRGCVLILHGNAGCAFQCAHYADVIQRALPLDVFMVEFPGYADRSGKPTEKTLDEAAEESLRELPVGRPIYLVGESLGTGVAAFLAGQHPDRISGVVLLAPYNRLSDVGQAHIRILPVRWLLIDRFPAEDNLRNFHGPLAVLVAGRDTVIPERFGRRLYDGYRGPKRLWEFPDGNHGTVMIQPAETWEEIFGFLQAKPL
jgi:pimeloyl-ACP methyl ester carboxylesterase